MPHLQGCVSTVQQVELDDAAPLRMQATSSSAKLGLTVLQEGDTIDLRKQSSLHSGVIMRPSHHLLHAIQASNKLCSIPRRAPLAFPLSWNGHVP